MGDAERVVHRAVRAGGDPYEGMPTTAELVRAGVTLRDEAARLGRELAVREAELERLRPRGGAADLPYGPLELRRGPGGSRHYLRGRVVSVGTRLHLLAPGALLAGRYEWSSAPADRPTFHFRLPGSGGQSATLELPEHARLVWPDQVAG